LTAVAGALALTAALLTGPLTGVAGAAPAGAKGTAAVDIGASGDPVEIGARAYLQAYPQLTPAAARAAAAQQAARKQVHAELIKDAASFGGAWFDPPSGILHVAVTTAAAQATAARLGSDAGIRLQTHRVSRTYAQLESRAAALRAGTDKLSRAARGQVGIDVKTNSVVAALPKAQVSQFANAATAGLTVIADPQVSSEADVCSSRSNCNDSLRSGLVVNDGSFNCSLGFTARDSADNRWALVSGHCRTSDATWGTAGTAIGPITDAVDSGVVDAGAILVNNATYRADRVGRIYTSSTSWSAVNGSAPTMSYIVAGETVCLSARIAAPTTVGNPCAVIANTSDATNRGLVRVEGYDACPGDSGGGWYWLSSAGSRIAYGLHSRSSDGCNAAGAVSWFSALPQFWTGLTYETG
jgi:streptogrisin C